jgi:hypothetical protein
MTDYEAKVNRLVDAALEIKPDKCACNDCKELLAAIYEIKSCKPQPCVSRATFDRACELVQSAYALSCEVCPSSFATCDDCEIWKSSHKVKQLAALKAQADKGEK